MKHGDFVAIGVRSDGIIPTCERGTATTDLRAMLGDQFMVKVLGFAIGPCTAPDFFIEEIFLDGVESFTHGAPPVSCDACPHLPQLQTLGYARLTIDFHLESVSGADRPFSAVVYGEIIDRAKT